MIKSMPFGHRQLIEGHLALPVHSLSHAECTWFVRRYNAKQTVGSKVTIDNDYRGRSAPSVGTYCDQYVILELVHFGDQASSYYFVRHLGWPPEALLSPLENSK